MLNNLRTLLGSPNSSHRGLNSANQTSSKKGKKTAVLSVQVDLEQAFGQPTTVDQDLFVFGGGNGIIKLATPPKKPLRIVEPLQTNPIPTISPSADPTLVFFRSKTSPPSQLQPESNQGLAAYSGENKISPQSNSDPVGASNLPRPARRKSRTIILQPDTAVSPYSGEDLNINRSRESMTPIKLRTPSPKSSSASQERRRAQGGGGSGGSQTKRGNGQTPTEGGEGVTSVFSAEKLREQDRTSTVENQRMLTISSLAPLPKPASRRRTPSPRGSNNGSLVSHVDSPELKVSRPRRATELPPSSRVFLSAGISGNLHLDPNERKDGASSSSRRSRRADDVNHNTVSAEDPGGRRNDVQRRRQSQQQQQQRELAAFDGDVIDRTARMEDTSNVNQLGNNSRVDMPDNNEPVFRVTRRIPVMRAPQAFNGELKETARKEAVISPVSSPASSPLKTSKSLARMESSGSTSTSAGVQSNSPFEMMKKRINMAKETLDGSKQHSSNNHDSSDRTSVLKEAISASVDDNGDGNGESNRKVRQGHGEDVIVGGNKETDSPNVVVAASRASVIESRRTSVGVSKENDLNLLSAEAIRSSLDPHQSQQQHPEPLRSPKPPSEMFLQSVAHASPKKSSRRNVASTTMMKPEVDASSSSSSSNKRDRSNAAMTASLQQQHQQRRQQMTANVSTRRKPLVPQTSRVGQAQSSREREMSRGVDGERNEQHQQLHQPQPRQQQEEKRSNNRRRMEAMQQQDSNVNGKRRDRVDLSSSDGRRGATNEVEEKPNSEMNVDEDMQQPVLPLRTSSTERRRENFIQAGLATVEMFLGAKSSSTNHEEQPTQEGRFHHQSKVEHVQTDRSSPQQQQQQHSPIRPSKSATNSPLQNARGDVKTRSSPEVVVPNNLDKDEEQKVEIKLTSNSPRQQQQSKDEVNVESKPNVKVGREAEESASSSLASSTRATRDSPSMSKVEGGDRPPLMRQPQNVEQQKREEGKKSPLVNGGATVEGSIDTRSVPSKDIRAALESLAQIPSPANAPSPPTVARPSPPFDARKSLEQQQKSSTPPKRAEAERRMASRVREAFERRKLDETLELCDEWKRLNPRSAEVWYHSGRAHLLRGEVSPSEHHLNNALKLVTSLVKEYDEDDDEYFSKDGGLKQLILRELGKIKMMTNARDECLKDLTKRAGNSALNHVTKAREISPCSAQLCVLRAASLLMATSSPHAPQDEGSETTVPSSSSRVSPKSQNAFTNELDQAFNLAFDVLSQIGLPATQYARVMHKTGLTSEADSLLEEVCNRAKRGEPLKACVELLRLFRSMESAKADANEAYSQGKFGESIRLFSKALELDPLNDVYNAIILSNRAASYMALGDFAKAVVDCDSALKLVPTFQRARIRRARALLKMNKFRESISDFEMAMRSSPTTSLANELAEARKEMKDHQESQKRGFFSAHTFSRHSFSGSSSSTGATSGMPGEDDFGIPRMGGQLPRPPQPPLGGGSGRRNTIHSTQPAKEDLYKILGVSPSASAADIRKAYHRAALKHHPDKNVGDSEANQRFKKVADAFHTLGDPQRRRTYDLMSSSLSVPMM